MGETRRAELRRAMEERIVRDVDDFAPALSRLLTELLADYAQRDRGLVLERLSRLRSALAPLLEGAVDLAFGGSVARQTYVDGVSDVDCLLFLERTPETRPPAETLTRLAAALDRMPVRVRTGAMALTIGYPDGSEIQMLPAMRSAGGRALVPDPGGEGWADVGPADFADTLRGLDRRCGYKLIPSIKLAKAAMTTLPAEIRVSGYHLEMLAVAAFADYGGPMTTSTMLLELVRRSADGILSPALDVTGQSTLVDSHLGPTRSRARRRASRELGLLHRSMIAASMARSLPAWRALLEVRR